MGLPSQLPRAVLIPRVQRMVALLAALLMLPVIALLTARAASAVTTACGPSTFTVTRVSAPKVYLDLSTTPNVNSAYEGYTITNSSTTAYPDVWVKSQGFGGTAQITLNASSPGVAHIGPMAAGATTHAYFYLTAAGATTAAETHNIAVFAGRPDLQSGPVCLAAQSLTAETDIAAAANKVTSVVSGPTPPQLGGIVTITVSGNTGVIGSEGIYAVTPASYPNWPADKYRLQSTNITMTGGNTRNVDNSLYETGLSSPTTAYVSTFRFEAIGVTTAPTSVSPMSHISSGNQTKHTAIDTAYQALPQISPADNHVTMVLTGTPGSLPSGGGTTHYTLTATNTGTASVSLDDLVLTLPTGETFTAGTALWQGAATVAPTVSGQSLTFDAIYQVAGTPQQTPAAPSSTATFTFDALLPAVAGTYTTQAVGHVSATQIDTTALTTDNSPATADATVRAASTVGLSSSAATTTFGTSVTLTAPTGPGTPTGTVSFSDVVTNGPNAGTPVSIGTSPVTSGTATLTSALPAFGSNTITATYSGDRTHDAAVSTTVVVQVTAVTGSVIVNQFRLSGPGGAYDQYVELYNTGVAVPLAGFKVATASGNVLTLPYNAPTLPQYHSYLAIGDDYSLNTVTAPDSSGVATLGTGGIQVIAPDGVPTVTDAVGSSSGAYSLGTPLPALNGTPTDQYAWVRLERAERPVNTSNNAADFKLVSTSGGLVGGVSSTLGTPSPRGVNSPWQHAATLTSTLLDTAAGENVSPNRVYVAGSPGSLTLRRRITNNGTGYVSTARIRINALSEVNGAPLPGAITQPPTHANLRIVNPATSTTSVTISGARVRTVSNLSLDAPAAASPGGGLASTLTVPLPGGELAPGSSVDVAFTFAVDNGGAYWFGYDVDATDGRSLA